MHKEMRNTYNDFVGKHQENRRIEISGIDGKVKVKVKFPLCLTKYHAIA
jgi:hypothetical protein